MGVVEGIFVGVEVVILGVGEIVDGRIVGVGEEGGG